MTNTRMSSNPEAMRRQRQQRLAKANHQIASVIGELTGPQRDGASRSELPHHVSTLEEAFRALDEERTAAIVSPFRILRGDGFCGIARPQGALRTAMILRTFLRSRSTVSAASSALDACIAVEICDASRPQGSADEASDGSALRQADLLMERARGSGRRLLFATPWPELDSELDAECALLDAVVARWSKPQAEAALLCVWFGRTQKQAAEELGVTQPAIAQRLGAAHADAVKALCARYERAVRVHTIASCPRS